MTTSALIGIARYELVRVARDKLTLFFLLVLPVLVVIIVGSTFGGTFTELPIGVIGTSDHPATVALVDRLDASDAVDLTIYTDEADLRRDVRTGRQLGGLIIEVNAQGPNVRLLTEPSASSAGAVRSTIRGVIDRYSAELVAADVALELGAAADPKAAAALTADLDIERTLIERNPVGNGTEPPDSEFAYTVPSQLVLFVFVSALGAGAGLVDLKRLGIARRMLSTPASNTTVILGLAGARFALATLQASLLIGIGTILFGIDWGDPLGVIALVVLYALVAVGAGLLVGANAKTPDQAMAIGVPLAMGMGMLGGTMWPLEIVGDTMRTVGHAVPQAWAMDGWVTLIFDGGTITDLGAELGALALFAAVLLAGGAFVLNRNLTR